MKKLHLGIFLIFLMSGIEKADAQTVRLDVESAEALLEEGRFDTIMFMFGFVDADWFQTPDARSLLSAAARHGSVDVVDHLIELQVGLSGLDGEGSTPLHAAINAGRSDMALYLLDRGADPGVTPPGSASALQLARASGLARVSARLEETEAVTVPIATDIPHQVYNAILTGDLEALGALLDAGVNANAAPDGAAPLLHTAVITGSLESVQMLRAAGADTSALHNGETASQLAARLEFWSIAAQLGGNGGVEAVLAAISADDEAQLARLLEQGADPNGYGYAQRRPLVEAVLMGRDKAVDRLLAAGADPALAGPDGNIPLLLAVLANDPEMIRTLVAAGADPNAIIDGAPLLSVAVLTSEDVARGLLESGADPSVSDAGGVLPADLAWSLGNVGLSDVLGGTDLGKPRALPLIEAIGAMDKKAIREALKYESPNQKTPEGIPYLHVLMANVRDPDTAEAFLADPRVDFRAVDSKGRTLLDVRMARSLAGTFATDANWAQLTRSMWSRRADSAGDFDFQLQKVDANGLSGLNKIILTYNAVGGFLNEDRARRFGNMRDGTGMSPIQTAVLAGNADFVAQFIEAGVGVGSYDPPLQEIARSRGDWKVLAALPYDRTPPKGFEKGASTEVKKEMQRRLRDWGYYTGDIDGVLGSGSQAALSAYFTDVEAELKKITTPEKNVSKSSVAEDKSYYSLTFKPQSSWCSWRVIYWEPKTANNVNWSERFVGCVEGGKSWNSNGSALLEFSRNGTKLRFFGGDGWEGDVDIR